MLISVIKKRSLSHVCSIFLQYNSIRLALLLKGRITIPTGIAKWVIWWMALSILNNRRLTKRCLGCHEKKLFVDFLTFQLNHRHLSFGFSGNDYLVSYPNLDGDDPWKRWSWKRFVCLFLIMTIFILVTMPKGNMVITLAADSKSHVLPRRKEICMYIPLAPFCSNCITERLTAGLLLGNIPVSILIAWFLNF